ncbi:MAG: SoxR reducing system RseC family protein [Spirochaetes bacterium]|nr:SoxR reducing system RseC family protein [Spirochaetota bacterium]
MEQGIVIEIRDGMALVETGVSSSCEGCAAGHSCLIGSDGAKRRLWMDNDGGARVGDEVAFRIAGAAVVMSAVVVYLVPAAMLIGGIILGASAGATFGLKGDLPLIGGGAAGLILSVLFSLAASALMKKKKVAEPRMVDITRRGGSINCG